MLHFEVSLVGLLVGEELSAFFAAFEVGLFFFFFCAVFLLAHYNLNIMLRFYKLSIKDESLASSCQLAQLTYGLFTDFLLHYKVVYLLTSHKVAKFLQDLLAFVVKSAEGIQRSESGFDVGLVIEAGFSDFGSWDEAGKRLHFFDDILGV